MSEGNIERLNSALEGRYRIERELGEGGMATVYLAEDLKHDRKVALKILKPELAAVLGGERFLQEIKVTANLQHPHILPLHDSGAADTFLFYVMPYVEGESLRARLDREKQLPIDEAVRIAVAVGSALDYAHRREVVHRDIKPANILLHEGQPVVADFGIALAVNAAGGSRLTETGLSIGTPHYMSPEQASGDRQLDGRSDVYALAAMLYEMLTGDPPFSGSTAQSVLAKILTEKPRLASDVRDATPQNVAYAVQKGLAKLPADRFATAEQFVQALKNPDLAPTLVDAPAATGVAPGVAAPGVAVPSRRRSLVTPLAAAAALVAGLVIGGFGRAGAEPEVLRVTIDASDHPEILSIGDVSDRGPAAVVSPDGRTVVFVGLTSDGQSLYRRNLDSYEIEPIVGTEGAFDFFFSPDGASILFHRDGGKQVVPLEGGVARVVMRPELYPITVGQDGFAYGTSPDAAVGPGMHIFRTPMEGDGRELVAAADSGQVFFRPQLLPDGRTVLASLGPGTGVADFANAQLVLIDLESGSVEPFLPGFAPYYAEPGFVVFHRTDGLAYAPFDVRALEVTGPVQPFLAGTIGFHTMSVSTTGHLVYREDVLQGSQLVWVDLSGAEQGVVGPVGTLGSIDLAPEGTQVALALDNDIWIYSTEAGVPPLRLTFGELDYDHPSWAADGRSLVMRGGSGAGADVYRIAADGTGFPEVVRDEDVGVFRPSIAPSGGATVFYQDFGGAASQRDIFAAIEGWDDVRAVVATPANERAAEISPDGRWLVYVSDVTGTDEVYVSSFPSGAGRWPISNGGGWEPVWSPDGSRIFFRTETDYAAADVSTEPGFRVTRVETLFPRGTYASSSNIRRYDVHPDGDRLLMTRGVRGVTSLKLVLNWSRELGAGR